MHTSVFERNRPLVIEKCMPSLSDLQLQAISHMETFMKENNYLNATADNIGKKDLFGLVVVSTYLFCTRRCLVVTPTSNMCEQLHEEFVGGLGCSSFLEMTGAFTKTELSELFPFASFLEAHVFDYRRHDDVVFVTPSWLAQTNQEEFDFVITLHGDDDAVLGADFRRI